ncbi:hypothetical protein Tco_0159597, partial [Tanacetum coccineum]
MINGDAGVKNGIFIPKAKQKERGKGISKVLVSSKKGLRDVEEDLV